MSTGSPPRNPPAWTTQALLRWTTEHFEKKGLDSPRLSAEMLLAHVLSCKRLALYMDPQRPASDLERSAFRALVERALQHEPVDYLVGHAPFFALEFDVSPAVLIPRPATETLIEHALQHARVTPGFEQPRIADIGTGSGIIAICLAKHLPGSVVVATDISDQALQMARHNAKKHGVLDRIDFRRGHLLEPLDDEQFTYLCSNPPYIPDHEWDAVEPNVKNHEPHGALRGGTDGLDLIRPLIAGAAKHLQQPGQLLIEIAACQKQDVLNLVNQTRDLEHPRVLADHEALPRILVADRKG